MPALSRVTLVARGHPNVKATHAKTLELVPEGAVSPRGTCILGVAARGDLDALARLRGPAVFELRCAGQVAQVRATLTPAWLPGEPLILRTRPEPLTRRTLAHGADTGAAGLDRGFVAALADAAARLEVEVAPEGGTVPGALFLAHPAGREDMRRGAAARLADLRLRETAEGVAAAIAVGGRVLLESAASDVWAEAAACTREAGGLVTLVGGWPAGEGAQALAGLPAPAWSRIERWPAGRPARRGLLGRLAQAGGGLVLPLPAGQAEPLLALAAKALPARAVALVVDPNGPLEEVRPGRLADLAAARAPEAAAWLVTAGAEPDEAAELDPALLALARRLRAEGVATKTLSAALAEVAAVSKRDAFNLLVKLEN